MSYSIEQAEKARQRADAYKETFNTPAGNVVLSDLAFECYATRSTFAGDHVQTTAYREGMRAVFLMIMELVELDTDDLFRLAKFYDRMRTEVIHD